MHRGRVERKGKFTPIPAAARKRAGRKKCSVCFASYDWLRLQHIHHLIPRRWLEEQGFYEHGGNNLLSVCNECHGKVKVYEDMLYRGDVFGFLQGMKVIGFPVAAVVDFALSIGLKEFGQWQL